MTKFCETPNLNMLLRNTDTGRMKRGDPGPFRRGSEKVSTLSRISSAALFVNVTAKMFQGGTLFS